MEQCDGGNLGGNSCQSLGFDMGNLACSASCTLDVSGCSADPQTCIPEGGLCILDPSNPASGCCPPGVMGAVFGLCAGLVCVGTYRSMRLSRFAGFRHGKHLCNNHHAEHDHGGQ